jgi:peptidoglycan/xylan/chitin deacetylase (PgdA/CDA1 family)
MYLARSSWLIKKLYSKALWRGNAAEKKLYLTFDDGPLPGITTAVLELLKEKNVQATFFCVGQNVEKHPDVFKKISEEGHAIGNHSFSHVNGWNAHTADYLENVERCRGLIGQSENVAAKPLFRPPYGKLKRSQYISLEKQYTIVMWDVLSGDYDKDTSPEQCLKNVTGNMRNGSIIVFHDSLKAQKNMEYALPRFIDEALAQGYSFGLLR